MFSILLEALHRAARIEVMVARGPLPPFTDDELTELIGMDRTHLGQAHHALALVNHAWQDPDQLRSIGSIAAMRMREITGELWHPVLGNAVDVRVDRVALEADRVLMVESSLSTRRCRVFRRGEVPVSWDQRPGDAFSCSTGSDSLAASWRRSGGSAPLFAR